jgi:hypothetical protein
MSDKPVPRPGAQGGDYRPHYRKRETDAYIDSLEAKVRELEQALRDAYEVIPADCTDTLHKIEAALHATDKAAQK